MMEQELSAIKYSNNQGNLTQLHNATGVRRGNSVSCIINKRRSVILEVLGEILRTEEAVFFSVKVLT
jgi:hypothetical protein